MRYYLDTNTLVFVLLNQQDEIDGAVADILEDYENSFHISTVVVKELILLYKSGKFKKHKYKTYKDIFEAIEALNYQIKPTNLQHLTAFAKLQPAPDHKDPNDHLIIAQAISDKIPIITSDKKFKHYEKQDLKIVFNKR